MSRRLRDLLLGTWLMCAAFQARAAEPVYVVSSFDGAAYSTTFVFSQKPTIFAHGGRSFIIQSILADLYYWEITGEYKIDPASVRPLDGTLRVRKGRRLVISQELQDWTILSAVEQGRGISRVLVDAEARQASDRLAADRAEMTRRRREHTAALQEHERLVQESLRRLGASTTGELRTAAEHEHRALVARRAQEPPNIADYEVRPVEQGFVIDLPPGTYTVEIADGSGAVLTGSRMKLVVFSPLRTDYVGYLIIPTGQPERRARSTIPNGVVHLTAESPLCLVPFYQNQYKERPINAVRDSQSSGSEELCIWRGSDDLSPLVLLSAENPCGKATTAQYGSFRLVREYGRTRSTTLVPAVPGAPSDAPVNLTGHVLQLPADARTWSLYCKGPGVDPDISRRTLRLLAGRLSPVWFLTPLAPLLLRFALPQVFRRSRRRLQEG